MSNNPGRQTTLNNITTTLLTSPLPLPTIPHPNDRVPIHTHVTTSIASLQLHPALESLLHILNMDLPAAHFLVRHMQGVVPVRDYDTSTRLTNSGSNEKKGEGKVPPKLEGMLLHGLLHRLEGDYDNAKAWYADVARKSAEQGVTPDAWTSVWSEGVEKATGFIDAIREWRLRFEGSYARGHAEAAAQLNGSGDGGKEGKEGERQEQSEKLREKHEKELRALWEWCVQRFGTGKWEDADGEFVDGMDEKYAEMAKGQVVGGEGWRNF